MDQDGAQPWHSRDLPCCRVRGQQPGREGMLVPFWPWYGVSTGRSFLSCLISSRIFSWSVLCFWGRGRSRRSDACRMHQWDLKWWLWLRDDHPQGTQPGGHGIHVTCQAQAGHCHAMAVCLCWHSPASVGAGSE